MPDPSTFYTTGGTLPPDSPSYVRRPADDELYDSARDGHFCFILTCRQMGKSSLMAQAAGHLRDDGVSVAIVDLTMIGNPKDENASDQWYFGIADTIREELDLEVDLSEWWDAQDRLPALQRLMRFYREVVLANTTSPIVIFVDEIDYTIGMQFADDFFAAIRACHNDRALAPEYRRLCFVLLGVASPSDLISDKKRTPFNLGRRIELTDFTVEEARPLARGLRGNSTDRDEALDRVLYWTDGHPYLTQKVCRLADETSSGTVSPGEIDRVVEKEFFAPGAERKETNLSVVRNRLAGRGETTRRLLRVYQQVLRGEAIEDDVISPIQNELKLIGLLKEGADGVLVVRNRIYARVFGENWIEETWSSDSKIGLETAAQEWDAATNEHKASYLLTGERLSRAREWSRTNREELSVLASAFLDASEDAERQQKQTEIEAERKRAARLRKLSLLLLTYAIVAILLALTCGVLSYFNNEARKIAESARDEKVKALDEALRAGKRALAAEGREKSLRLLAEKQARIITSRQLAYQSVSERNKRLDRSLLLAAEALRIENTFEARNNLFQALQERPKILSFLHNDEGAVTSVAFSPDGKTIAAAYRGFGINGGVMLWDVDHRRPSGDPLPMTGGGVWSVAFSPDGKTIAAAYRSGAAGGVALWDVGSRQRIGDTPLAVREGGVTGVAFSPDGKSIAAAYHNRVRGGVVLWEESDLAWRRIDAPLVVDEGGVWSVAFSPDGRTIAAGYGVAIVDGGVALWSTASRERLSHSPLDVREGEVRSVAFSPDGRTIAAAYRGVVNSGVVLWDTASPRGRTGDGPLVVNEGGVLGMAFGPDGKTIAAAYGVVGGGDGGVVLWDTDASPRLDEPPLAVGEGIVWGVAFSPDGKTIAAAYGGGGGGVVLWDAALPRRRIDAPLVVDEGVVLCVAFSPDGKTIAAGCGGPGGVDGGVVLWDIASRRRIDAPLVVDQGIVWSVAFSPDGKTIAAAYGGGANGGVALWDIASRRRIDREPLTVKEGGVIGVVFSPDGKTIAAAYRGVVNSGVVLWDAETRRRLGDSPLNVSEGGVMCIAYSPDGKTIAAGFRARFGGVGGVALWDAVSLRRIGEVPLAVKEGEVRSVTFSPDGRTIAAGFWGSGGVYVGGVVLWDAATRRRLVDSPLATRQGGVTSLAYSPDGRTIAAGTGEGSVVTLWDVDLDSWQRTAGRIANRNLTREEWRQFFPDESYRPTFPDLPVPSGHLAGQD